MADGVSAIYHRWQSKTVLGVQRNASIIDAKCSLRLRRLFASIATLGVELGVEEFYPQ